jgi:hypothetical protein
MAVQFQHFQLENGVKQFPSTKYIPTKSHCAVWLRLAETVSWGQLDRSKFQLINNSAVLNEDVGSEYDLLELRVADTPDELGYGESEISKIAEYIDQLKELLISQDELVSLSKLIKENEQFIKAVGNDLLHLTPTSYDLGWSSDPLGASVTDGSAIRRVGSNIDEVVEVSENLDELLELLEEFKNEEFMRRSNNLSDVDDMEQARANIGFTFERE